MAPQNPEPVQDTPVKSIDGITPPPKDLPGDRLPEGAVFTEVPVDTARPVAQPPEAAEPVAPPPEEPEVPEKQAAPPPAKAEKTAAAKKPSAPRAPHSAGPVGILAVATAVFLALIAAAYIAYSGTK